MTISIGLDIGGAHLKACLIKNNTFLKSQYSINEHGDYVHKNFEFSCHDYFTLSEISKKEAMNI